MRGSLLPLHREGLSGGNRAQYGFVSGVLGLSLLDARQPFFRVAETVAFRTEPPVAGVDDATPAGKVSRTPGITVAGFSCQNLLHDIGLFNAREPEVEACMAVCQFAMIESHQLQHCGM
jgi:hypothetical protein